MIDREKLRVAVEHDINLVLAACLPQGFASNVTEPPMVIGCMHPVEALKIDLQNRVICSCCYKRIDQELVDIRMQEYNRRSSQ